MNFRKSDHSGATRAASGMTLVEMLVSASLGLLVLTTVAVLYVFGLRTFGALDNYADMDGKSRLSMDLMLREIRQASLVVGVQTNGPTQWLQVECTNFPSPSQYVINTFTWLTNSGLVLWDKTAQPTRTLLKGCDGWSVTLYSRAPDANGNFVTVTNPPNCKRITMTWTCSRTNIISKMNTESIVTADVVLRNLQE